MRWKYCLVTTEEAYYAEMDRLGVHRSEQGSPTGGSAAAVTFVKAEANTAREDVAVVCILGFETKSGIEIAGLLVHEAVHVWQREVRHIGESEPSDEFMAYGIQWIAQELMEKFWAQVVGKELVDEYKRSDAGPRGRDGGGEFGPVHQVRERAERGGRACPDEEEDGEAPLGVGRPLEDAGLHNVWRAPALHEEI